MARNAVAPEVFCALRQEIARIEGRLAETLRRPDAVETIVLRRNGAAEENLLETGALSLDRALGGGLARASLIEVHGAQTRDAGAVSGFALALAARALAGASPDRGLLWIGAADVLREAGRPHGAGIDSGFGIGLDRLLFASAQKPSDALWIAEEATRLARFAAIIVELRGRPARLDLTATRRLHRRAMEAGHPVFLLRQAAAAEPTAAPVRLCVSPAPAGRRKTLAGLIEGSIGPPGFHVAISKSRSALPADFILEWNADERRLQDRPAHPGLVAAASRDRPDPPPAARAVVAFRKAPPRSAAGGQPPGSQRTADRRAR